MMRWSLPVGEIPRGPRTVDELVDRLTRNGTREGTGVRVLIHRSRRFIRILEGDYEARKILAKVGAVPEGFRIEFRSGSTQKLAVAA